MFPAVSGHPLDTSLANDCRSTAKISVHGPMTEHLINKPVICSLNGSLTHELRHASGLAIDLTLTQ